MSSVTMVRPFRTMESYLESQVGSFADSTETEQMWYLGNNIPSYINGIQSEDYELVKIRNSNDLISLMDTWSMLNLKFPQAILIEDLHLSKLNAEGFVERRRKKGFSNVSMIVFSEEDNLLNRPAAFSLGADGYFSKRISFDDLLFKIRFSGKLRSFGVSQKDAEFHYKLEEQDFMAKRIFDVVCASFAILMLAPLLLLIAIIIKLESPGPILYVSQRAGSKYKIFDFYKFRTMREGADQEIDQLTHLNEYEEGTDSKVFYKFKNDPRVTRFGQFLRNTSLDELPQLINILKGDMSIVGNRPLPLYEAELLTDDDSVERFLSPSGLTGLWQVMKRGTNDLTSKERIMLDKIYARKCSLLLDLKIIILTIPALIQKEPV